MKELEFYILAIDKYGKISVYGQSEDIKLVFNGQPIPGNRLDANMTEAIKKLCPDHVIVPVLVVNTKSFIRAAISHSQSTDLMEQIRNGKLWEDSSE